MSSNEQTDKQIIDEIRAKSAGGQEWSIDPILLSFLSENIFYAEISRRIHKISTRRIPTCAVTWDPQLDSMTLMYNPDFLSKYTARQIRGVLKHEYNHLVFGHLASRRRTPNRMWNIATDLAINSLIYAEDKRSYSDENDLPLPKCGLVPGRPVYLDNENRSLTKEEEKARPIAGLIRRLKPLQSSEQYFNALMEESKKQEKKECQMCGGTSKVKSPSKGNEGQDESDKTKQDQAGGESPSDNEGQDPLKNSGEGNNGDDPNGEGQGSQNSGSKHGNQDSESGSGHSDDHNHGDGEETCPCCGGEGQTGGDDWIDSMDDHSVWDDIGEDQREYVENRVRDMVEKAVHRADQESTGWGNIPAEMRDAIRKSISRVVPWRAVLRQFIGTLLPGGRTTSIKRINRRYPYIHPGVKRSRAPGLLIATDQSGSVDDDMLALLFAELTQLAKHCDIDILPFDSTANQDEIYRWCKGQPPPKGRTRCGGTNFDAVTKIVNDPRNRGRWDGVLIATDGACSEPYPVRIKRGWVLPPGCNLFWESNELQVFVSKDRPMKGAWR